MALASCSFLGIAIEQPSESCAIVKRIMHGNVEPTSYREDFITVSFDGCGEEVVIDTLSKVGWQGFFYGDGEATTLGSNAEAIVRTTDKQDLDMGVHGMSSNQGIVSNGLYFTRMNSQ